MPVNTTWNGDANDNKLATAGNWSNDAVPGTSNCSGGRELQERVGPALIG
jgi:hypothetical protein